MEIGGFHGDEDSSRGLLGRDAVYCCSRTPTFQRSMLPPSSPLNGGSMDIWKVSIVPQNYTSSQPGRHRLGTNGIFWETQLLLGEIL